MRKIKINRIPKLEITSAPLNPVFFQKQRRRLTELAILLFATGHAGNKPVIS